MKSRSSEWLEIAVFILITLLILALIGLALNWAISVIAERISP